MSTYETSKDYDALFEHLCEGGEAVCRIEAVDAEGRTHKGVAHLSKEGSHLCIGIYTGMRSESKDEFAEDCYKLNLEWFKATQP
jgi:hypothetical protein